MRFSAGVDGPASDASCCHSRPATCRGELGLAQHRVAKTAGVVVAGAAQHGLGRVVVACRRDRCLPVGADHPAGQRPSAVAHVGLGVAVAVAEREQLHEFAGEVLVGGPGGIALAVKPPQHGRVGEHRIGQRSEIAELERAQLLVLGGHVRREVDLSGRGGKVVVPQQRQLLVDGLLNGCHPAQPPARQVRHLIGERTVIAHARCRRGASTRRGAGRTQRRHRRRRCAGVRVGIAAQRLVEVRRPVSGSDRVDLYTGRPEPRSAQQAGSGDPSRRLSGHVYPPRGPGVGSHGYMAVTIDGRTENNLKV
jgi:hypothetical protein